jgi:hypothetical protein
MRYGSSQFIALFVVFVSFIGAPSAAYSFFTLSSDPQALAAQQTIESDFNAVSQFSFSNVSPLFQELFDGQEASDVTRFFFKRVTSFSWDPSLTGNILASAAPGTTHITVGPALFDSSIPQIYRISTLIHEARHNESKRWGHVGCNSDYTFKLDGIVFPETRLAHTYACDRSAKGAYGIEYVFLRAIVNSCTNCTEKMKLDAKLYGDYEALVRIDNSSAAEALVRGANPDFTKAKDELGHVLKSRYKTDQSTKEWVKHCEEDESCLHELSCASALRPDSHQ